MRNYVNICYKSASNELLDGFKDTLPDGLEGLSDISKLSEVGIDSLLGEIAHLIEGHGGEIFSFFLLLFGVTLIMFFAELSPYSLGAVSSVAVGAISSIVIFYALYPVILSAEQALSDLSAFFSALTPLIGSMLALGGGASSAVSTSFGMQLTLWLMGTLGGEIMPLLVSAMFATSAIGSVGEGAVSRIAKSVKGIFSRLMGIMVAALAGVLALQTYISVSADSAAMRIARYAAAGVIPVVGNAVSGALSTLAGGLMHTGSIIGAGSVVAIVATALSPLVMLLLYKLCFHICSTLLEFGGKGTGVSCISGFSGALDALISVYIMTMIIYIFEIVVAVWGGASILG